MFDIEQHFENQKPCSGKVCNCCCYGNNDVLKWQLSNLRLNYTRKDACSVTAFNSTDIRSVQDNVATPLTAMMVAVCISIGYTY